MRALAINVSGANLMGGLLVPGDRVDILVSYEREDEPEPVDQGDGEQRDFVNDPNAAINDMMAEVMGSFGGGTAIPPRWVTEEVLSDVRVIAVGSALTGSRQAQLYGLSAASGGSTITVELSTQDAMRLVNVQANGRNPLTLLLRPEDTSTEGGSRLLGS
jgi:Flp pilus assembly protein CpaB